MKIEHVALWAKDLEKMKEFYETYFNVTSTKRYHNPKTGFYSYFVTFDSGSRLELMAKQHLSPRIADSLGYAHWPSQSGLRRLLTPTLKNF